jgi:hypothetical protein
MSVRDPVVEGEHASIPGIGREFMPPAGRRLHSSTCHRCLPQAGLGPAIEVNAKQDMAIASRAGSASRSSAKSVARRIRSRPRAHRDDGEASSSSSPNPSGGHVPVKRVVLRLARLVEKAV